MTKPPVCCPPVLLRGTTAVRLLNVRTRVDVAPNGQDIEIVESGHAVIKANRWCSCINPAPLFPAILQES